MALSDSELNNLEADLSYIPAYTTYSFDKFKGKCVDICSQIKGLLEIVDPSWDHAAVSELKDSIAGLTSIKDSISYGIFVKNGTVSRLLDTIRLHSPALISRIRTRRTVLKDGDVLTPENLTRLIDSRIDIPKNSTKGVDFFICHSSYDYDIAKAVEQILERADYIAFIAHKDLKHGKEWHPGIKDSIRNSKSIIVVASKNYQLKSTYCHYEIGYADCLGSPIHTMALENEKEFDPYINYRQLTNIPEKEPTEPLRMFFAKIAEKPINPSQQDLATLEKAITNYHSNKSPKADLSELLSEAIRIRTLVSARLSNSNVDITYKFFIRSAEDNKATLKEMQFWETYKEINLLLEKSNKPFYDKSLLITLHEKLIGFVKGLEAKK